MKFTVKGFGILSVAVMLALGSCNDSATGTSSGSDSSSSSGSTSGSGTVDSASSKPDSSKTDSTTAKNVIGNASPDQATIDYMVPGNAKEMAWLMAGEKNGTSAEIKAHAKMMLADHKKLGDQVAKLMQGKNLSKPPVDTMNVVNLTEAKGKEWDKAWVDKMVSEHQGLLDKLKQSETEVRDSSLKKLVMNTEPVVQRHLDMVKKMQDKMK